MAPRPRKKASKRQIDNRRQKEIEHLGRREQEDRKYKKKSRKYEGRHGNDAVR